MKKLMAAAGPREHAPAKTREFGSAAGSKTFKGQLQRYDAATPKVTVRREDGKIIKFDLQLLLGASGFTLIACFPASQEGSAKAFTQTLPG